MAVKNARHADFVCIMCANTIAGNVEICAKNSLAVHTEKTQQNKAVKFALRRTSAFTKTRKIDVENVEIYARKCLAVHMENAQHIDVKFALPGTSAFMIDSKAGASNALAVTKALSHSMPVGKLGRTK